MQKPPNEETSDPLLESMMNDAFGPPDTNNNTDGGEHRLERGLDAVAALSDDAQGGGVRWAHEDALSLNEPPLISDPRHCFACGKPSPKSWCAKCGVAGYCSRDCQMLDWSAKKGGRWGGHKAQCAGYKALGRDQSLADTARRATLEQLLARVRLYLCPFALANGSGGGRKGGNAPERPRGLCFLQLGCTLSQLALPAPRDCAGNALPPGERSALLHWVTLEEFDAEISGSDPALSRAAAPLADAVGTHDDLNEVVVLVRAGCGFAAVLVQPLVPERRVCLTLATEYEGRDCLQIDCDDL